MQCQTDCLGGGRMQAQPWAVDRDSRPDKICKMCELCAHQLLDIDSLPPVLDEQVLIGCERPNALIEAPDKVFRLPCRGRSGDGLHESEHVLGAMIDFVHQKKNLVLVGFPIGHVLGDAKKQASPIIGDAAHAMSPIGGVGINLAVQDAVAAANILTEPLRTGAVTLDHLARVQARHQWPTRVTQSLQRAIQNRAIGPVLAGTAQPKLPLVLKLLDWFPALRGIPAWVLGIGVRPEHIRTKEATST